MLSSAYRWIVLFLTFSPNSSAKNVNKSGPKVEPCGTPLLTLGHNSSIQVFQKNLMISSIQSFRWHNATYNQMQHHSRLLMVPPQYCVPSCWLMAKCSIGPNIWTTQSQSLIIIGPYQQCNSLHPPNIHLYYHLDVCEFSLDTHRCVLACSLVFLFVCEQSVTLSALSQVEGLAEQVGVEHPRKLISFTLTGEKSGSQ